jgi:hypothetical protein
VTVDQMPGARDQDQQWAATKGFLDEVEILQRLSLLNSIGSYEEYELVRQFEEWHGRRRP